MVPRVAGSIPVIRPSAAIRVFLMDRQSSVDSVRLPEEKDGTGNIREIPFAFTLSGNR